VSLAAAIKQRFGIEARLTAGSGGVFDVTVNGKRIFCKHDVGSFPDEEDVLDDLAALIEA